MNEDKIKRINFLSRKSRETGLTEDEKAEQAALRREYAAAVKASLTVQLDNTYIVTPDGKKTKLGKKN